MTLVLPDVLEANLRVVFCGTAAGTVSAARGEYYAGPGNKFWHTLFVTQLTDRLLAPAEFRELLCYGIGLTDLEKEQSGADAAIAFRANSRQVLREKIARVEPGILCFSSKRAAKEFFGRSTVALGLQAERIHRTAVYVAPSTSGLASRSWDITVWADLAAMVRRA